MLVQSKNVSRQARDQSGVGGATGCEGCRTDECRITNHESSRANKPQWAKGSTESWPVPKAPLPRLPFPRSLGSMSGPCDQERTLRRLGLVYAGQEAAPTPVPQIEGPAHPQATILARPVRRRLEEVQPIADRRTARCLHRRGDEASEPATPEPVGSADRTSVFDTAGIRKEGRRKNKSCRNCHQGPANKGDFAIHIGYTPAHHRHNTGTTPSRHGARKEGRRRKAE